MRIQRTQQTFTPAWLFKRSFSNAQHYLVRGSVSGDANHIESRVGRTDGRLKSRFSPPIYLGPVVTGLASPFHWYYRTEGVTRTYSSVGSVGHVIQICGWREYKEMHLYRKAKLGPMYRRAVSRPGPPTQDPRGRRQSVSHSANGLRLRMF